MRIVCFLLYVTVFVSLTSYKTAKAEVFIIGVEAFDYMPYFDGSQGEYHGFSRAFFDLFAKTKGYTFQYKPVPVNRLYILLKTGLVDFKFPANKRWAPEMKTGYVTYYSGSIASYIDGLMVTRENKGKALKEIRRIGTLLGFTAWDYLSMQKKGLIHIVENPSFPALMVQVIKGRLDGAYFNPLVCEYKMKHHTNSRRLVFDKNLPHTKSGYALSTIHHFKIIGELNFFMKDQKDEINALKKEYGIDRIDRFLQ